MRWEDIQLGADLGTEEGLLSAAVAVLGMHLPLGLAAFRGTAALQGKDSLVATVVLE